MEAIKSWFTYVSDNREYIQTATYTHAQIVLFVLFFATVFSVLLGVFVAQRPVLRAISLAITGIFLTIPSLALFALFIPLVGIGNPPAMIALFMYGILPILRNTVTGLDAVSPAVIESAKGMGMGSVQQLVRIRLPLAWPVIMAGIRLSSLLLVGIAAIAVLVGGDGLGSYIADGIFRQGFPNANNQLAVGIVFTVLLGLVLDAFFATIQRFTTSRGLRI